MTEAQTIDPAIVEAGRRAAEDNPVVDFRTLVDAPVADIRTAYDSTCHYWNASPPPLASVTDRTLEGPHGGLQVRIYRPSDEVLPAVLYFHGGGFMLGSIESHDTASRILAQEARATVVSVDYRLAPEYRFPVAIEECLYSCDWLKEHGDEVSVDASRVAVGGDSAGANLALTVLNERRDALDAGLLFYGCYGHLPEFGYPMGTACKTYGDGRYGLGLDIMRRFYTDYLRNDADGADPRFCSLKADLRGLPPVLLTAAALDPLLDDAEAMRLRLTKLGVSHRYILYPGVPHGFLKMAPEVDIAYQAFRDAGTYLQERWKH